MAGLVSEMPDSANHEVALRIVIDGLCGYQKISRLAGEVGIAPLDGRTNTDLQNGILDRPSGGDSTTFVSCKIW